ncbi:MAG: hypothetical protein AAB091_03940 [Elusimicrobiota bacterium]
MLHKLSFGISLANRSGQGRPLVVSLSNHEQNANFALAHPSTSSG